MSFQNKNKFDTLVQLVGFAIEIYYDARPYECQNSVVSSYFRRFNVTNFYIQPTQRSISVCVCLCVRTAVILQPAVNCVVLQLGQRVYCAVRTEGKLGLIVVTKRLIWLCVCTTNYISEFGMSFNRIFTFISPWFASGPR